MRLVWVVNPRNKTAHVYHPTDAEPTTLGLEDVLEGEDIVLGFALPVRTVFGLQK